MAPAPSRGQVVAVDLDPRFLAQIDAANLSVHSLDVTREDQPAGPFDLVHARHLLLHLPERLEVLDRLERCLTPGGWLLLEEGDAFPVEGVAAGAEARLWAWYVDALARAGADSKWARRLPTLLDAAGVVDVAAKADVPVYRGGYPTAEMVRLCFIQVAERDVLDAWPHRPAGRYASPSSPSRRPRASRCLRRYLPTRATANRLDRLGRTDPGPPRHRPGHDRR